MRPIIPLVLLVSSQWACDTSPTPLEPVAPVPPRPGLVAASAPDQVTLTFVFDDLNPCSGEVHTVTIVGSGYLHDHDGRTVLRLDRTITTSSGFTGRGTSTHLTNGSIANLVLNDMLTHPSGDRIRAHLVLVVELATGEIRVLQGAVTCVRGADA